MIWQLNRSDRLGRKTLLASHKPHAFRRRSLHAHLGFGHAENLCQTGAHGVPVRSNLRSLADQGHIDIGDLPALGADQARSMGEKLV